MGWIVGNWLPIVIAVILLIGIFIFLRYVNSLKGKTSARGGGNREKAAYAILKVLKKDIRRKDLDIGPEMAQKVASAMVAVIEVRDLPLERVLSNDELFAMVMVEALDFLIEEREY